MATKHQRDQGSSAARPGNAQRPPPPWAREEAPDDSNEPAADADDRIVERPDGYHWISEDGRNEFGPFATLAEALADMEGAGDDDESAAEEDGLDDLDIGGTPDDE
jgi:hypothetical protein